MDDRAKSIFSYVLGFISGIIILLISDKSSDFVRKNAAQSCVFCMFCIVTSVIIRVIPVIGIVLSKIALLYFIFLWCTLITKSSKMIYCKLPVISYISEKLFLAKFESLEDKFRKN